MRGDEDPQREGQDGPHEGRQEHARHDRRGTVAHKADGGDEGGRAHHGYVVESEMRLRINRFVHLGHRQPLIPLVLSPLVVLRLAIGGDARLGAEKLEDVNGAKIDAHAQRLQLVHQMADVLLRGFERQEMAVVATERRQTMHMVHLHQKVHEQLMGLLSSARAVEPRIRHRKSDLHQANHLLRRTRATARENLHAELRKCGASFGGRLET
mmetsp:Transcript_12129/g.44991  ORF Transcript_12129/g.44991 Transcript_12129/m.44991 type:complete len:211 (+) Transcript_12129:933-1565(+)